MNLHYPQHKHLLKYSNVTLYKSKDKIIAIAHNKKIKTLHSYSYIIFKIFKASDPRSRILSAIIEENPIPLDSEKAAHEFIPKKDCQLMGNFQGTLGVIKFLEGYYLIMIKEIKKIAKLGKHKIFSVEQIEYIQLFSSSENANEMKYLKMLKEQDMEQDLYSSFTYDLTKHVDSNMAQKEFDVNDKDYHWFSKDRRICDFCEFYLWNYYLLSELDIILNNKCWLIPTINGYIEQRICKAYNLNISITLISRRSRHHAGTRYLTRGINEQGFVANFVETEQIVIDLTCDTSYNVNISSFTQVRGSVPIYWYQEPKILTPKPQIYITHSDPLYLASKKHINDLISLFGQNIYCINLVKKNEQKPRESKLSEEFDRALHIIHSENILNVEYMHIDMKQHLKLDQADFIDQSQSLGYYWIMNTGLFLCQSESHKSENQIVELQNGVIRSSCVDCLDRTNTFQFLIGEIALEIQIAKLKKCSLKYDDIQIHPEVYQHFYQMYSINGDIISLQYGNSLAHKHKLKEYPLPTNFEFLTSFRRHFKNNMNDQYKQHQIDLLMGNFKPYSEVCNIMESKTYIKLLPNLAFLKNYCQREWPQVALNDFKKQYSHLQLQNVEIAPNLNPAEKSKSKQHVKSHRKPQINMEILKKMQQQDKDNNIMKYYLNRNGLRQRLSQLQKMSNFNKELDVKNKITRIYNKPIILQYDSGSDEESQSIEQKKENSSSYNYQKIDPFEIDIEQKLFYDRYLKMDLYCDTELKVQDINQIQDQQLFQKYLSYTWDNEILIFDNMKAKNSQILDQQPTENTQISMKMKQSNQPHRILSQAMKLQANKLVKLKIQTI